MSWDIVTTDRTEFEKAAKLAGKELRGLTYRDAIKEALYQMMEKDDRIIVMGEGVDHYGWVFGTTAGLLEKFGAQRVFDTPIAENSMTGIAIGLSLAGMRPILVHMRNDFLLLAMDQMVNHAAKWKYMSGGRVNVPLVIRAIIGRGWGSAAQHSQSLQAYFMHTPGLKVVIPSSPYDVKGLLISSIEDEDPVVFIEARLIYEHIGYVPEEIYTVPIGKGTVRKEGKDITIVAVSYMVFESIKAAEELEKEGISIEVIDPRTIKPLDEEIIFKSVKKTGRVVIADTGWLTCGITAEISARITEKMFRYLKAPVLRVALPDTPTPASYVLEKTFYPDRSTIISKIREIVKYK